MLKKLMFAATVLTITGVFLAVFAFVTNHVKVYAQNARSKKSRNVKSTPENKKYGLFVGINDYPGMENDLSGAVADARNLRRLLTTKFAYPLANTTLLTDKTATRANIIAKIKLYGGKAVAGDTFVFTYSGHGTQVFDADGDESENTY